MYYSAIGILAILILLIENQDVLLKLEVVFDSRVWKAYRRFLFAVLVYYVTDVSWGVLESKKLAEMLFADTTVYFIAMGAGVALWTQFLVAYLDAGETFRRICCVVGTLVTLLVIGLTAVNIFTPVLFTVDELAVYTPLLPRYGVIGAQVALLIWISVFSFWRFARASQSGKKNNLRYHTMAIVSLLMALFLFIQLWYPYLPLYAIAYLLGTCRLKSSVLADATDEYRQQMSEASRIQGIQKALRSLLDHMPGMAFTKDAETGRYLACNQAYAEHVRHGELAKALVGKTDAELFDEKTAAQISREDQIALSMDEPYVVFEEDRDERGHPRQLQTTKLSYRDSSGRLCLLGMSVDVTDQVRIERESVLNRQAYERARSAGIISNHIAQALARGYADLYYINTDTGDFIEYRIDDKNGSLQEVNRGRKFFDACAADIKRYVHPEDQAQMLETLSREKMLAALDRSQTFVTTYRLVGHNGKSGYVSMKVTRMADDQRFVVVGVTDVDDIVRQRQALERAREEQIAYARLKALQGDFLWVYIVDPKTMQFREYSAPVEYDRFGVPKMGEDFFGTSRENVRRFIHPQDVESFLEQFTEEHIMAEVKEHGSFSTIYRIMIGGKPTYVQLKAAMVGEQSEEMIIGVTNIDAAMRQEEAYAKNLAQARDQAHADALTGVKNRHAFLDAEAEIEEKLSRGELPEFALAVFDVNNLKTVNDTAGHQAGDEYLLGASKVICDLFKHSPVYRVGGDEFAVIIKGEDYAHLDERIAAMQQYNEQAVRSGGIVVAWGMARFEGDKSMHALFERADGLMYANKMSLKSLMAEHSSL